MREAQGVPEAARLAPRHTKPGTLDLTASTLFVGSLERHARICKLARQLGVMIMFKNGSLNLGSALQSLFTTLHSLHGLWRQKTFFDQADLQKIGLGFA